MRNNRPTLFMPRPTNGRIDIYALTRYLSENERSLIIDKIEQKKHESMNAIREFARQVQLGTNKAILQLSNEVLSTYALAALDMDLIQESQFITLHLQLAALIEFFQYPYQFSSSKIDGVGKEAKPFEGDITTQIMIHHYTSQQMQKQLYQYFGMTQNEWHDFCELMKDAVESEQYCYVYQVPEYVANHPSLNQNIQLMNAHKFWLTDDTCYLFVPSFTMLQNRLAVLAKHFNRSECVKLLPLFGTLISQDVETLKANGVAPFPLPCPLLAPAEPSAKAEFYLRDFHNIIHGGQLSFAFHDYYHAWKELQTKTKHRTAHFYIINLLREYASTFDIKNRNIRVSEAINRVIETLIDGDRIYPTVENGHPILLIRNPGSQFVHTFDHILDYEVGVISLFPDLRAELEPAWEFIRHKYHQYQQLNVGTDWQDNFDIDPERDLVINTSKNSMQ